MHRSRISVGLGVTLAFALAAGACSSDDDEGTGGSGATNGTGASNGNDAGASNGDAGADSSGSGTGGASSGSGMPPRGARACSGYPVSERAQELSEEDAACTGAKMEAEGLPVDMFIMMDASVSMTYPAEGYENRWDAIHSAVEAFVEHPAAANIGIGFGRFNLDGTGNEDPNCNVARYADPVVPIGFPADVGQAILDDIEDTWPNGLTPTPPALEGAIQYARAHHRQHPDRETVVVLVTDGMPTLCYEQDENPIALVAEIAAEGFDSEPSIRTFVVGLEGGFNLNHIAMYGGTSSAYLLDPEEDISETFLGHLLSLASSDLACNLELPPPSSGSQQYDETDVRVKWTSPTGLEEEIPKVSSEAGCASSTHGGWYFPDPSDPTKVKLCPCTCSRVGGGSVEVWAGCKPITVLG